MRVKSSVTRRNSAVALSVAALLTVGLGTTALPGANAAPATAAPKSEGIAADSVEEKGAYDARQGSTDADRTDLAVASAKAAAKAPARDLRAGLGKQAVFDLDGLTGTVRQLARLDGYLTARSSAPARSIAMNYVRANASALGLAAADLATFDLRRDYVDILGTHHLSWTQSAGGVTLFGNGLQAAVTKDGRLVSVGGSPVSGLRAPSVVSPDVASPRAAIGTAKADVGEAPSVSADDSARPVLFVTSAGVRRGWETITMSAERPMLSVIDAEDGRTLFRQDLGSHATANPAAHTPVTWITPEEAAEKKSAQQKRPRAPRAAKALAYQYFPGARRGGKQVPVNYTKRGWLKANAKTLSGNNSHTWADVKDDNRAAKSEEIRPKSPGNWKYRMTKFRLKWARSFCNRYPCSWNPNKPFSWRKNLRQNATQVFYYVNNFHDYLKQAPIGFNEAAGNFQKVNRSGKGKGKDAVRTQTSDGANSDGTGLPDGNHVDNANMATPPDGRAPTMQMYLQHQPYTSYPDGDPFSPTNVGDEADTVYHEYTHGLSNRLVVDSNGRSTLGNVQAGAMGEAWSDWYAMDYLVGRKFQRDRAGVADVVLFQYDGEGVYLDRTEPIDCKVGANAARCPGGSTGHTGGYTYADYGQVGGGPEVHTDGEIWSQTLWDFRDRFGKRLSRSLITRAMELSADNPSFLDMRNAILLADKVAYAGKHQPAIWKVFAKRGMGYFAGSLGGNDIAPGASFEVPPTGSSTGVLSGTVTDKTTGDPIANARVVLAFQGSTSALKNPSTRTAADGSYSLSAVPFGTYPKLLVSATGFDPVITDVTVDDAAETLDVELERNWASSAGGASIDSSTGPNFGAPCSPEEAIDQSAVFGWSTTSDLRNNGTAGANTPKTIVVKLPEAIDITRLEVDPTAICGDGLSASTGSYRIRTSTDGVTWSAPTNGTFKVEDMGMSNVIPLAAPATDVQYVQFTIRAPLVVTDLKENADDEVGYSPGDCPGGGFSGCLYQDLTEIRVFGTE